MTLVHPIGQNFYSKLPASGKKNKINQNTERNIAIINASGISTAIGAITAAVSRTYTTSWKNAILIGLGASIGTSMILLPKFLNKTNERFKFKSKYKSPTFIRQKQ